MEPETAELASTAAATMVKLLTTDAWKQVKMQIGGLWRRFRPEHAPAVEAELAAAHDEAVAAAEAGDDSAGRALSVEWESRLRRLLAADAAVAVELGMVVAELARLLDPAEAEPNERHARVTIRQRANASDHGNVIQVAGNAQIGTPLPHIQRHSPASGPVPAGGDDDAR